MKTKRKEAIEKKYEYSPKASFPKERPKKIKKRNKDPFSKSLEKKSTVVFFIYYLSIFLTQTNQHYFKFIPQKSNTTLSCDLLFNSSFLNSSCATKKATISAFSYASL